MRRHIRSGKVVAAAAVVGRLLGQVLLGASEAAAAADPDVGVIIAAGRELESLELRRDGSGLSPGAAAGAPVVTRGVLLVSLVAPVQLVVLAVVDAGRGRRVADVAAAGVAAQLAAAAAAAAAPDAARVAAVVDAGTADGRRAAVAGRAGPRAAPLV